jgi:hypothetical protein
MPEPVAVGDFGIATTVTIRNPRISNPNQRPAIDVQFQRLHVHRPQSLEAKNKWAWAHPEKSHVKAILI